MKPVRVYTTHFCGYCVLAKRLLDRRGVDYTEIDVSRDPETRQWLVATTRQRTVPQIFFGETSIGGFTELRALDVSGRLSEMLAD